MLAVAAAVGRGVVDRDLLIPGALKVTGRSI